MALPEPVKVAPVKAIVPQNTAPPLCLPGDAVERLLGQGGMGAVYQARREATGERCAVKVILPACADDDGAVKRFLREADVLRQIDHRRIVRFREVGTHAGQFYFVLDFIETIDLPSELAKAGPTGRVALACRLACQLLEGLGHAHARGFVHRDIKPANVLVSRDDHGLTARLADFGLAKSFETAGLSGMTDDGTILGTVPFMAPEQVLESRYARPAADLYSVGATLYAFLSAQLPDEFGKKKPFGVILEDEPVPLLQRAPHVPAELAALVHRALARLPTERFADAESMRQAMLPFAAG